MRQVRDNTGNPASDSPAEILGLLRNQRALYGKLETIASRQRKLITGDEPAALIELLADRKKVATELTALGQRLQPVQREWRRFRGGFDALQRAEAEKILGDIKLSLRRMIESDEQDVKLLSARKQLLAQSLVRTNQTRIALDAYRAPAATTGQPGRFDEAT
ncbi:MAG: hypothetical protein ACYTHJ_08250 [Planctomycetota bacterium]